MGLVVAAAATGVVVLQARAQQAEQAATAGADLQASVLAATGEVPDTGPGFKEVTIVENRLETKARLQVQPESDGTTPDASVNEALSALGFTLDAPDVVYPARENAVPWYGRIYIQRAPGVVLKFDDTVRELKTGAATVESLLAEQKVTLDKDDRVEPDKMTAISANMVVKVVRVETKEEVETESIAFETQTQDDPGRYVGEQVVKTAGVEGTREKKFSVVFEDGKEVKRELKEEKVTKEPVTEIVLAGTKAKPAPAPTPKPSGPAVGPYADMINDAAAKYGQSAQELMAVMLCESGGYQWADNHAGNLGLYQFSRGMWGESWNPYRGEDIFTKNQIYAAALAWSLGMRGRWGC